MHTYQVSTPSNNIATGSNNNNNPMIASSAVLKSPHSAFMDCAAGKAREGIPDMHPLMMS